MSQFNDIPNSYARSYAELEKISSSSKTELACFVALHGEEYYPNMKAPRLMIIGRAVNGWRKSPSGDSEHFSRAAVEMLVAKDRFTQEWGLKHDQTHGTYSTYFDGNLEKKYYLSRSPFWNTAHSIWRQLTDAASADRGDWYQSIAWSNMYKLSPMKRGNPSNQLCKQQSDACMSILRDEIVFFNPSHILFPVGDNWFSWADADFEKEVFNNIVFESRTGLVQKYAETNNAKIVVTKRPETVGKEAYVSAVLTAFGQANSFGISVR